MTKETSQSTPAIEAFTAAMPASFISKQNVVVYVAGYLII